MRRKLSLAIAVALGVASLGANALGLGDLNTKSTLNQYFDAKIELLSLGKEEISDLQVGLAPAEAFQQAGVDRPFFLSRLKFKPVIQADGSAVILITSREPVREPFLNFLIELNWPKGRLVREYTVLLDPPVTLDRRPAAVQQPSAASPRVTAPAARSASTRPATPARQFSATPADAGGEYGPTQKNDTLWRIAEQVRYRGATMEQTMMALFDANPNAFISNNINNLKVGEILRIPSRDEILAADAASARMAFREQVNQWRSARAATTAEPTPLAEPQPVVEAAEEPVADTAPPPPQDELKIASARPQGEGEAGADSGDEITRLREDLIAAEEARTGALEEGKELQSRVTDLESQLEDMQRLLTLKSDQLAQLQAAVLAAEEDMAEPAAEAEPVAEQPLAEQPVVDDTAVDEAVPEALATAEVASDEMAPDQLSPLEADDTPMTEMETAVDETGAALPEEPAAAAADEAEQLVADGQEIIEGLDDEPEMGVGDAGEEPVEPEQMSTPEPVAEAPAEPLQPEPVAEPESAAPPEQAAAAVNPEAPTLAGFIEQAKAMFKQASGNTAMMGAAVAVFIVLLTLLGILISRSRSRKADFEESILVDTLEDPEHDQDQAITAEESVTHSTEETSFLSDFSPADIDVLQDETGEVDPLAEADVYIAYGRFKQAEELIRQAIERQPQRTDLIQKLFEILYATKDAEAFTALAESPALQGMQQHDPEGWQRIISMGAKLMPTSALFATVADEMAVAEEQEDAELAALEDELRGIADLDLGDNPPQAEATAAGIDEQTAELDGLDLNGTGEPSATDDALQLDEIDDDGGLDFDLDIDLGAEEADALADVTDATQAGDQALDDLDISLQAPEDDDDLVLNLGDLEESLDSGDQPISIEDTLESVEVDQLAELPEESPGIPGEETLQSLSIDDLEASVLDDQLDSFSLDGDDAELTNELVADLDLSSADEGADAQIPVVDLSDQTLPGLQLDDEELISIEGDPTLEMPATDDPLANTDPLGSDSVNTMLDLATAYVDMGDAEGARSILEEVLADGNEGQKSKAQALLDGLG